MKAVYIGMDVHKKYTVAMAMDEQGRPWGQDKIMHGASIRSVPWKAYFGRFEVPVHVAMEACEVSYPIWKRSSRMWRLCRWRIRSRHV
jgi:hypothetical protein